LLLIASDFIYVDLRLLVVEIQLFLPNPPFLISQLEKVDFWLNNRHSDSWTPVHCALQN
jgi:hypothetical protein